MTKQAARVADVRAMTGEVSGPHASIREHVDTAEREDRGELADARKQIDKKHTCPSGGKEQHFQDLAEEMIRRMRAELDRYCERFDAHWKPYLDVPRDMSSKVGAWDTVGDAAQEVVDRVNRLNSHRAEWQGAAGQSYWAQLPAQSEAVAQLVTSASAQASGLASATLVHYKGVATFQTGITSARAELQGALRRRGGNGVYMTRTAQATATLESLNNWLDQLEKAVNDGAQGVSFDVYNVQNQVNTKVPSTSSAPVGGDMVTTGKDVTIENKDLGVSGEVRAMVCTDGLHIDVVG